MRTMTKISGLFLLGLLVLVGTAQAQNAAAPMNTDPNMMSEMVSGEVMQAPVYENGISGDMYYGGDCCDYGNCADGCGLFPFVRDVAQTALSPVYFVASLFSAGVYPDCGCAPPYRRVYRDPCDQCGNWVGAPTLFGHPRQPCNSCNSCEGNRGLSYYNNAETWDNGGNATPESFQNGPIGPINNNQTAPAPAPAPIKTGAFQMQNYPSRISVRAPVVPVQQNIGVSQNYKSQNYIIQQEEMISQNVMSGNVMSGNVMSGNMTRQSNRIPMDNAAFSNASTRPKMNGSFMNGSTSQASFNRNQAAYNTPILMGSQNLQKTGYNKKQSVNTALHGNQFNNSFGKDNVVGMSRTGMTVYPANGNVAPAPYYQTKSNTASHGTVIRQVSGNDVQYHQ